MIFYFYHIVYMNLLIVFKKIFFFVSKMARRVKQEINETNESQIGMDSLIPNGTVFEMHFVTLS